ncbi:hypothetical protein CDL12_03995 [Handroanthus impetiginosus]|uniref:Uncharacterized protein n=1 Tax=Handroanthus impetiginosus TaxID=429701 RepID=A0A2G9I0K5_9LAMI|nr:hypothetical protein CDL12_03995 [Handroanthus impetiginosus]
MRTTIHNNTSEDIEILDRYLMDVGRGSGYDGPLRYLILGGGKKDICSSIYLDQAMEERRTQQILVKISGETKLVLHHEDFSRNKEVIIFEMHDRSIAVNYSQRTRTTLADLIRCSFCRRNCGG